MAYTWHSRRHGEMLVVFDDLSDKEYRVINQLIDLIHREGGPIPDNRTWIADTIKRRVHSWDAIRARLLAAGFLAVIVDRQGVRRLASPIAEAEMARAIRRRATDDVG